MSAPFRSHGVRVMLGVLPFALAAGVVYLVLLRARHQLPS
jgi:hypothetical protein